MFLSYAIQDVRYDLKETTLVSDYSKLDNFKYITLNKTQVYNNFELNQHHWTTNYVWNCFFPLLMKDLNLKYDEKDYELVCNYDEYNKVNLDYHDYKKNIDLKLFNFTNNITLLLNQKNIRLNKLDMGFGNNNVDCITNYHRLFRLYHETCLITNENSLTKRNLLLNADSMFIPVIPLIIPYFNNILYYDNRTDKSYKPLIDEYIQQTTDIIFCFIEENIHISEKWKNIFQ